MKYYEVKFLIRPYSSDASDLLAAMAGETGFETFEETDSGLTGYIQQQAFDHEQLDAVIAGFPLPGTTVTYTVSEAEDRDWNEQWEQEGFEPIVIDSEENGAVTAQRSTIVIHDGRHLPPSTITQQPTPITAIEIDAHLAFGTGTHETTRMVCATLAGIDLSQRRVLDCGCGTGILGIAAMKLGAQACIGYDIDEWSTENTRHNAVINQVELTTLLGDASILNTVEGTFNLVMANINRNILLQDMPLFRQKMAPHALLILSGFYTDDIPLLTAKANSLGLTLQGQREENGWACLLFEA